jgi:hypothetical protein
VTGHRSNAGALGILYKVTCSPRVRSEFHVYIWVLPRVVCYVHANIPNLKTP